MDKLRISVLQRGRLLRPGYGAPSPASPSGNAASLVAAAGMIWAFSVSEIGQLVFREQRVVCPVGPGSSRR